MSAQDSSELLGQVAVPRPLLSTFTYRIPSEFSGDAHPGARVLVPFGRHTVVGCLDAVVPAGGVDGAAETPPRTIKPIHRLLDREPVLAPPLLALCRWIADYYVAPLGMVIRAALPPGLLATAAAAGTARGDPELQRQVVRISRELPTLSGRVEAFGRAVRQREAYELLESLGGSATVAHMSSGLGFSRSVLQGLADRGLAEISLETVRRDPFANLPGSPADTSDASDGRPITPTVAQSRAIAELRAQASLDQPAVALLRGVTGSGKTLVYLELLEELVSGRARSAIVLVPEIALTPQTVGRFRERFGSRVAILHSGLSAGERYDEWRALREGDKQVVIGARSAIFAPVRDLGAIILDEEHEGTYKQSETPRYHARSVAVMRARLEGCLCLLGSATPSMESWANASSGRYRLLELTERVTGHPLPSVELVDLRAERRLAAEQNGDAGSPRPESDGTAPLIFGNRLRSAIAERLERGEQSILLLNRRGYATFVECEECGHVWSCRDCNVSLKYHRRRRRLVCHHCAFETEAPTRCVACGAPDPSYTGIGTEQVERRLGELFPAARLARMDVDTTGTKWAHFEILERVRRKEVDILLGTQMIAKGLDYPGVTLVGVVNADVSLNLPDFRASERTFQLLAQVAGRSGRGDVAGGVLVQTSRPLHPALVAAQGHDYVGFATGELEDREEPGYPPHRRLANLVLSGPTETEVAETAARTADMTRGLIAARELTGIDVVGPAPCAIDRIRGRWRWHALLKSDDPSTLGAVLRYLADHAGPLGGVRLEIDRDPESLM